MPFKACNHKYNQKYSKSQSFLIFKAWFLVLTSSNLHINCTKYSPVAFQSTLLRCTVHLKCKLWLFSIQYPSISISAVDIHIWDRHLGSDLTPQATEVEVVLLGIYILDARWSCKLRAMQQALILDLWQQHFNTERYRLLTSDLYYGLLCLDHNFR